jgi:hypothetical protein
MGQKRVMIPMTAPVEDTGGGGEAPLRRFWWLRRIVGFGVVLAALVAGSWVWLDRREARRLGEEVARWKAAELPIEEGDFGEVRNTEAIKGAVALLKRGSIFVTEPQFEENAAALQRVRKARESAQAHRESRGVPEATGEGSLWNAEVRRLEDLVLSAAERSRRANAEDDYFEYLKDVRWLEDARVEELYSPPLDAQAAIENAPGLRFSSPSSRARARELVSEWLSGGGAIAGARRARAVTRGASAELARQKRVEPWEPYDALSNLRAAPELWSIVGWKAVRPARTAQAIRVLAYYRTNAESVAQDRWPAVAAALRKQTAPTEPSCSVEPLDSLLQELAPEANSVAGGIASAAFFNEVMCSYAAISFAARMYSLDHEGREPPALSDLVPAYLPRVPRDPFDPAGGPLRYVGPGVTARPFVYSLWEGGVDFVARGKFRPLPGMQLSEGPNVVCFLKRE